MIGLGSLTHRVMGALAVAAAVSISCAGSGTTGEVAVNTRFVLDSAPAGFELCIAIDGSELDPLGRSSETTVVWGDRSAAEPWAGPLAAGSISKSDRVPVHDRVEPITVRGRAGYVGDAQFFQGVSSGEWGSVVTWAETPGVVVEVSLRRGTATDVVRLAETAVVGENDVSFPVDALGDRTEVLARGQAIFAPGGAGPQNWIVIYEGALDDQGLHPTLNLAGLRGGAELIDVMRFWAVHTEPRIIRGHQGIVYSGWSQADGPWGALWQEPDGQVIQLAGYATKEQTLAAIDAIAPTTNSAWSELKNRRPPCAMFGTR